MSLLPEYTYICTFINRIRQKDSYSGWITAYVDGDVFDAQIAQVFSNEAKIAAAQGVKNTYTITTSRALTLKYDDVFRRNKDGKVFRVTSDGEDNKTPPSSYLDMRQVTAEEWKIPASTDT